MLKKEWLEASTVMLMALQKKPYVSPYNYKILTLKRSEESSFMPSGYVFPGGKVEPVDSAATWRDFFKTYGVSEASLHKLLIDPSKLPPMFQDQQKIDFPKQLSLRLAAIREAFEESGVLLCRKNACDGPTEWGEAIDNMPELAEWRSKVQKDSNNFLSMCETLNIIPDIWGLKLWSNWLTPPNVTKLNKRFDTSFFTVCLPYQPSSCADGAEISKLAWNTPVDILAANARNKQWVPPPQKYEISRVIPFCMLEDLAQFAYEREPLGIDWFNGHAHLTLKDGFVFLLPGDELYGETDSEKYSEFTFEELRTRCKRVHRLEMVGIQSKVVVINVNPTYGHILPYTEHSPA